MDAVFEFRPVPLRADAIFRVSFSERPIADIIGANNLVVSVAVGNSDVFPSKYTVSHGLHASGVIFDDGRLFIASAHCS